jgi:hypothetical protein
MNWAVRHLALVSDGNLSQKILPDAITKLSNSDACRLIRAT